MNPFGKIWHIIAHQKSAITRALDTVAQNLSNNHEETVSSFHDAFQPSSPAQAQQYREKLIGSLKASISAVNGEHHSRDDHFESHDRLASLAQSTLNEQLVHKGVGDDVDAFFNRYGEGDLAGWIPVFLKIVAEKCHFQCKYPFLFENPDDETALVYQIESDCRIILIGDWGADNDHAANIRDRIREEIQQKPNLPTYVIHLGDIYYSGSTSECMAFLRNWPLRDPQTDEPLKGKSFALNGNHEMYSGGDGYFGMVLPRLGQKASYFLLRNDIWNFFGLDTAYVPGKLHDASDARLENQWKWLAKQMDLAPQRKNVFFTHNQPISANAPEHAAGGDLRSNIDELQAGNRRPIYGWFFGHEHKCYIYEDERVAYKARLIGHGSFPHDIQTEKFPQLGPDNKPLMAFAQLPYRGYPSGLAYSGYACLEIDGSSRMIHIRYVDEDGGIFHEEGWRADL